MKMLYKVVGCNIRLARKRMGFTQENMSEKCGMSLVHYGRLERGERCISLEHIALIAGILRVKPETLLEGMMLGSFEMKTETKMGNGSRVGLIVDFLCAGCSIEACSLMLNVCTAIAEHDKLLGDRRNIKQSES